MGGMLAHRGPDADGFHFDGPIGLAHRRLAILDLSDRGRQPMSTADGRFTIVFNGEIYNYLELREELRTQGEPFRTDTDTEVILCLYRREGAACLDRLNGMFAFAIWDEIERRLFVARDRIGIKPLYYALTPGGLAFASEAKALFACPGMRSEVDVSAIPTYMAYGYTPSDTTMFKGVRKLLPGHSMVVTASGVTASQYWDVHYEPASGRTAADTADELHDLLLDATRIHLRSDVPVGVFLSGGLDSSSVVSLLTEGGIRGIKTFGVSYRTGQGFDESEYARMVSSAFGTEHHTLYVEPQRFLEFIPGYVWHMDEPVTEAAALSLYFISRELRQHVTVALSGEGADELFAGYDIYRYMAWLEQYRRIPGKVRSLVTDPLLQRVPHAKVRRYAAMSSASLDRRYLGVSLQDRDHISTLYTRTFRESITGDAADLLAPYYARTRDHDVLTRMLYADLKGWLVDDLLIKADKMTMANSVELRVPFLDYRVVEFAATIPSSMKLRRGVVKWILKRAMHNRLPSPILERPKVGFPTPLAVMFRENLSDYLSDLLLSRRATDREYFARPAVERLIREHSSGTHDHHRPLWQLVVLEEWHRAFVDAAPAAACNPARIPAHAS